MSRFNPEIKRTRCKLGSSVNANVSPYLMDRVDDPVSEKDRNRNHCNDVFDEINLKMKGVGLGIPLQKEDNGKSI